MSLAVRLFRRCSLAGALLLPVATVHAAANLPLSVSPVVVRMALATEFAGVSVNNRGDEATGIEVEVLRVRWLEGREQYEATRDFLISPPSFRLQAKKDRLVRFRYSGNRQDSEGFYRLFIRQLPEGMSTNQINMVVSLGVPIFVAPLTSRPALTIVRSAADGAAATLRNTGNVTLNVLQFEGENCLSAMQSLPLRISPEQDVLLKPDDARCATSARTDRGLIPLLPL